MGFLKIFFFALQRADRQFTLSTNTHEYKVNADVITDISPVLFSRKQRDPNFSSFRVDFDAVRTSSGNFLRAI
jgi:hypothetical protein